MHITTFTIVELNRTPLITTSLDMGSGLIGFGFALYGNSICAARIDICDEIIIGFTVLRVKISESQQQPDVLECFLLQPDEGPIYTQTVKVDNRNLFSVMPVSMGNCRKCPVFFDPSNGKAVIAASLYVTSDRVYYDKHMLLQLPDIDKDSPPIITTTNHIAYLDNKGRVVVMDCSLLIEDV